MIISEKLKSGKTNDLLRQQNNNIGDKYNISTLGKNYETHRI